MSQKKTKNPPSWSKQEKQRAHQVLCQIGKEVERRQNRVDVVHDVSKAVRKRVDHLCYQQQFLRAFSPRLVNTFLGRASYTY